MRRTFQAGDASSTSVPVGRWVGCVLFTSSLHAQVSVASLQTFNPCTRSNGLAIDAV
jgi:hypothetical protein